MTTVGPQEGQCRVCELWLPIVNFTPVGPRQPWAGGYLARHWRPGLRRGYNCRGSLGGWSGLRGAVGQAAASQ